MRLFDEKGRLFGFINIIDLGLLFAVLLVIAGVGYRYGLRPYMETKPQGETKILTAVVLCEAVPPATEEALKIGDRLYYDTSGFTDRTISSVTKSPAQIQTVTSDGLLAFNDHPFLVDLIVEVEIPMSANTSIIMAGPHQVNIGKKFFMKTHRVEVEGIVLDIKD